MLIRHLCCLILAVLISGCTQNSSTTQESPPAEPEASQPVLPRVIFDTDANNELDDQHALAYLLFNSDAFDIAGVTVNTTSSGGNIELQYAEADRIMRLCQAEHIPLLKGADSSFEDIRTSMANPDYDGKAAVDFIISEARQSTSEKLVVIAVGKLTNVALALEQAPDIADKIRLVWLGSNYPAPGEHNLVNDIPAMNYLLDQSVEFELVMVRYAEPSGSDAVRVTPAKMTTEMAGTGPDVAAVIGRHGGEFTSFGDYSVNLFENAELYGDPPSRALFDLVAVAIVKNPAWGERSEIPAPAMVDEAWVERPENERKVIIWENFNSDAILADFFESMNAPALP